MAIVSAELALRDYIATTIIPGIVAFPAQVTLFVPPFRTFRQMPKITKLGSRLAYIIGAIEKDEHRVAGQRGIGSKEVNYVVDTLIYATAKRADTGGDQFVLLVETVENAYRTANTGMNIVDPLTGGTVWLHKIGEEFKGKNLTPMQLGQDELASDISFIYNLKISAKIWLSG
jgi:hypothetical protein